MSRISNNIYLTSNLLAAAFSVCLGGSIREVPYMLAFIFIFTTPAWLALYFCFTLLDAVSYKVCQKWILFIILLSLAASIPYLLLCGLLSEDIVDNSCHHILYLGEASAFGASLIHCFPIHRFFKNISHEIE